MDLVHFKIKLIGISIIPDNWLIVSIHEKQNKVKRIHLNSVGSPSGYQAVPRLDFIPHFHPLAWCHVGPSAVRH